MREDGRRSRRHVSMRISTCRELCQPLAATGFRDCHAFEGLSERPLPGRDRLTLIARRPS